MKKIIFIQLFVCLICVSFAQKNPRAYFEVAQFQTTDKKPYVEAYLNLVGNSLKWIKNNNSFKANVEIEYLFYVDTLLKKVSKVNLSSPEIADSNKKINFLDVQRFSLNDGTYKLIINIKDVHGSGKKSTIVTNLILHASDSLPAASDIEFVEAMKASTDNKNVLFKSGFEIMPYISIFLDANQNDFIFYSELYNASIYLNKNQLPSKCILSYGIYKDGIVMDGFIKQQRMEAQQINVVLGKFDISDLLTGKYELKIKLQDANGKVFIEKSKYFDRISNKSSLVFKKDSLTNGLSFPYNIDAKDSLKEMLLSIQPIAGNTDFNIAMAVLKDNDIKKMQNFLYNFWNTKQPGNAELSYYKYAEQVHNAQILFGSVKRKGYLTDRGRVFLQYGPPNSRNPIYNDADNYPYEIWQYYRINDVGGKPESNRMFVFADFNLTDIDFKLIHSTARGETNDIRWQIRLKKRSIQSSNLDDVTPLNNNGNADDFFNTPR
jgi:GWxTD domain-containing protein